MTGTYDSPIAVEPLSSQGRGGPKAGVGFAP